MSVREEALQPEDRDVADERKRVLECQPVVESMVGSPLILQELTKVSIKMHSPSVVCPWASLYTNIYTVLWNYKTFIPGVQEPVEPDMYKSLTILRELFWVKLAPVHTVHVFNNYISSYLLVKGLLLCD